MFLRMWRGGGPWRFHPGLELLGKCGLLGKQWGSLSKGIRGWWHVTQESRSVPQWGDGSCETRLFQLLVTTRSHLESWGLSFEGDFGVRLTVFQGSQEAAQVPKGPKVRLSLRRRGGRSPHESVWHCLVSLVSLSSLRAAPSAWLASTGAVAAANSWQFSPLVEPDFRDRMAPHKQADAAACARCKSLGQRPI